MRATCAIFFFLLVAIPISAEWGWKKQYPTKKKEECHDDVSTRLAEETRAAPAAAALHEDRGVVVDAKGQPVGRAVPCGVPEAKEECPLDYSLDLVEQSARLHTPFDPAIVQAAAQKQSEAELACRNASSSILESGGWCLRHAKVLRPMGELRDIETEGAVVALSNNQSYELPPHHVGADKAIVWHLIHMVDKDPEVTISDFGAGVGQVKSPDVK